MWLRLPNMDNLSELSHVWDKKNERQLRIDSEWKSTVSQC